MATQGDAQRQQAGRELGGLAPIARPDVAHRASRQAGRRRDLTDRRPSEAGDYDPPDRVDGVEPPVENSLRQRAACPPAVATT